MSSNGFNELKQHSTWVLLMAFIAPLPFAYVAGLFIFSNNLSGALGSTFGTSIIVLGIVYLILNYDYSHSTSTTDSSSI